MQEGALSSLFNTANNLEYVGPYPEPKFYGADYMSDDERVQFVEWYEEQKYKIVCNKQELLAYCMDDVNVLRQACCAFRNLFLKFVKMDPFREAITISSICKKVFRTMFLNQKLYVLSRKQGTEWDIPSRLKLFNGWRILDEQLTILLILEMELRYLMCPEYLM